MRILIWAGVLAPVLRWALILGLAAAFPGYSHVTNYLSELGARGAPHAGLMNIGGLVLVGALLGLFGIALFRATRPGRLSAVGASLLMISGLAFVAVGLFPCDPGCSIENPSTSMQRHVLAGMVAMSTQALAPLVFGLRLFAGTAAKGHAVTSLALGLVAVAAVAWLLVGGVELARAGLVQRTFQAAADLWVLATAVWLLGQRQDSEVTR